jgi:hypothetical protein
MQRKLKAAGRSVKPGILKAGPRLPWPPVMQAARSVVVDRRSRQHEDADDAGRRHGGDEEEDRSRPQDISGTPGDRRSEAVAGVIESYIAAGAACKERVTDDAERDRCDRRAEYRADSTHGLEKRDRQECR